MSSALDWYPTPKPIDLREPDKQVVVKEGVVRMENTDKVKVFWASCKLLLMLMGTIHIADIVATTLFPDATTYRNLQNLSPTDRAYAKQHYQGCFGNKNYFDKNTDGCETSWTNVGTFFSGKAVVAKIDPAPLEGSKPTTQKKHQYSQWESEADAAETPAGNVQSPSLH